MSINKFYMVQDYKDSRVFIALEHDRSAYIWASKVEGYAPCLFNRKEQAVKAVEHAPIKEYIYITMVAIEVDDAKVHKLEHCYKPADPPRPDK